MCHAGLGGLAPCSLIAVDVFNCIALSYERFPWFLHSTMQTRGGYEFGMMEDRMLCLKSQLYLLQINSPFTLTLVLLAKASTLTFMCISFGNHEK